jgi:hypothetical protein
VKLKYSISDLYNTDVEYSVDAPDNQTFQYGDDIILSNEINDITFNQTWYDKGHTSSRFLDNTQFKELINGITNTITKLIRDELDVDTTGFTLETYHKYVRSNEEHFKIVSKTRDLFSSDFGFPIKKMIPKFESLLGFELTDEIPYSSENEHIIVRINRPQSNDYNPPHKDMYESYDKGKNFQFLNFWVPIAGVTNKSSLPISPKSHLISEKDILRTIDGGKVGVNEYRVCLIKEWDGGSKLKRADVVDGEVLMFSSHMIHGLAINDETNKTRVALEFRLFKK